MNRSLCQKLTQGRFFLGKQNLLIVIRGTRGALAHYKLGQVAKRKKQNQNKLQILKQTLIKPLWFPSTRCTSPAIKTPYIDQQQPLMHAKGLFSHSNIENPKSLCLPVSQHQEKYCTNSRTFPTSKAS